ncbi:murein hydrolase activator EnvC family protein [Streptomyces sp. NPDC060275]|uniref:murein hydrolase activator EnvC family protein n=1 Tax=Streptomyces sp. NPDC060275 TaxID=3347090 RepID=UPI003668AF56
MRTRRWVSVCTRLVLLLLPGVLTVAVLTVRAAGPPRPAPVAAVLALSDPVPPTVPAAPTVPAVARSWPVGTRPVVLRGWEPPATPYGPGHRGVDLAAGTGAPVRAVAAGRVSFAGPVAGRGVVSVELTRTGEPPLRTTFAPVEAAVRKGDEVAAGELLGTVQPAGSHCTACLHWGLLRGEVYVNPLSLLPPWLLDAGPSRLLPVAGVPLPDRTEISPARRATPWRPPPP